MSRNNHPYHLVDFSPWPYIAGFSILSLLMSTVIYFHKSVIINVRISFLLLSISLLLWFRDIIREGTYLGIHTKRVQRGLKMGVIFFIVSEILFFVSFFWAFFHSSLSPSIEIGCQWPPIGIQAINPFAVPLWNTAILLGSGATVTWCHHSILAGNRGDSLKSLLLTISLGLLFTVIQFIEYNQSSFSISEGAYGSTFYVATGFHGAHVIIGTLLLSVSLIRLLNHQFTKNRHLGFEAAAWYWHFVDVVWLFLFIFIYWWGFKRK